MAYEPTIWKNREVERPRTFTMQENEDGTFTLIPAEGAVTEPGTPIVAPNMNKIENQLVYLDQEVEKKADRLQEDWITATLQNGWTGSVKYFRDQLGFVHIQGNLTMPASPRGTIFTLPQGYRHEDYNTRYVYAFGTDKLANPDVIKPIKLNVQGNGPVELYLGASAYSGLTRIEINCSLRITQ